MDKLNKISMELFNYQKMSVSDLFKKDLIQFTDLWDHQRLTLPILPQLNNSNLNKEIPQSQFLLTIQSKLLILLIASKPPKD
jgi:hypothetical protein